MPSVEDEVRLCVAKASLAQLKRWKDEHGTETAAASDEARTPRSVRFCVHLAVAACPKLRAAPAGPTLDTTLLAADAAHGATVDDLLGAFVRECVARSFGTTIGALSQKHLLLLCVLMGLVKNPFDAVAVAVPAVAAANAAAASGESSTGKENAEPRAPVADAADAHDGDASAGTAAVVAVGANAATAAGSCEAAAFDAAAKAMPRGKERLENILKAHYFATTPQGERAGRGASSVVAYEPPPRPKPRAAAAVAAAAVAAAATATSAAARAPTRRQREETAAAATAPARRRARAGASAARSRVAAPAASDGGEDDDDGAADDLLGDDGDDGAAELEVTDTGLQLVRRRGPATARSAADDDWSFGSAPAPDDDDAAAAANGEPSLHAVRKKLRDIVAVRGVVPAQVLPEQLRRCDGFAGVSAPVVREALAALVAAGAVMEDHGVVYSIM
jgi:hypothetical protein